MTNFKLPSKKQVYKQFLNHQLLGKKANLYFAEYGREGSGCKIIIESRMVDFDKYAYWQPINIQKFEVIIKDCEKCNVGNWFKIYFDQLEYANLFINYAIITVGILEVE